MPQGHRSRSTHQRWLSSGTHDKHVTGNLHVCNVPAGHCEAYPVLVALMYTVLEALGTHHARGVSFAVPATEEKDAKHV